MTRWRALALFGGVTVGEGLYLVEAGGARPFIGLGVLLFLAAGVVGMAGGEEYTWAVLGAAAVSVAVALPLAHTGALVWGTPPRFSGGIVPANTPGWIELGLLIFGVALVAPGWPDPPRSRLAWKRSRWHHPARTGWRPRTRSSRSRRHPGTSCTGRKAALGP